MRPYLAVIKDSFREAFVSRVLWILLALTTLLLLLLIPLGVNERAGAYFAQGDLPGAAALVDVLKQQSADSSPSPAKQLWLQFDDRFRQELVKDEGPQSQGLRMVLFELRPHMNESLDRPELYDAQAWAKVELNDEAKGLLKQDVKSLPPANVARLNRLLLEAAFPEEITRSRESETVLTYFGAQFAPPLAFPAKRLISSVLAGFIGFFVGVLGVMVGILVTAAIMPQTFEAGAIDLLLSKPVSRSLLYLTKFVGGCAFILINAMYMIGGLWLIVGLRYGMWNDKLLLCVPVFMFLFSIYYAVSALSGAYWRSAIISVVITILFWFACFVVGTLKNSADVFALNPTRLVKLAATDQELFASNERGVIFRWDRKAGAWHEVLMGTGANAVPGFVAPATPVVPVYDQKAGRLIILAPSYPQFNFAQSGNQLWLGSKKNEWKRVEGVAAPTSTVLVTLESKGAILAVSPQGIFRLKGDPTDKQKQIDVFGLSLPVPNSGAQFVPVTPDLRLRLPMSAAVDAKTGEIAMFDTRELSIFRPGDDGQYTRRVKTELEPAQAGVLALAGGHAILALADGKIEVRSAKDLKLVSEFRPEGKNGPRFVEASPDGRYFAILFHHRKLWLYDAKGGQLVAPPITGQGDVSGIAFSPEGNLLVADQLIRVKSYTLDPLVSQITWSPPRDWVERAYRYFLHPFYTVFPKPGELGNLVNYLLTEEETAATGPDAENLQGTRIRLNVWPALWSNLAFVAVVVGLGCLYTARKDF